MYRIQQDATNNIPSGQSASGSVYSNEGTELSAYFESVIPSSEVGITVEESISEGRDDYSKNLSSVIDSGNQPEPIDTEIFYVPNNLDLETRLSQYCPHMLKHIDKFYYVIDKLYVMQFIDKRFGSRGPALLRLVQHPVSNSVRDRNPYCGSGSVSNLDSMNNHIPHNNNISCSNIYSINLFQNTENTQHIVPPPYDLNSDSTEGPRFENMEEGNLDCEGPSYAERVFIPLRMKDLERVLTTNLTKQIIQMLIELGYIESDNQYIVGKKSKGYRLTIRYYLMPYKKVSVKNRRLNDKLIRRHRIDERSLDPVRRQIYRNMYSFLFDINGAEAFLNDQDLDARHHLGIEIAIDKIVKRDFFFATDDKTGRIFHNYCNLKKEFRQFIMNEEGNPLVEIDIRNSQPFLLSMILKDNQVESEDVMEYNRLTREGEINDYIAKRFHLERQYVKDQMWTLFFAKSHWQFRLKTKFCQEFPTVYSFIEDFKRSDHKALAIPLQKLEAGMVIDTIGRRLLDKGIKFITIHDSLMVSERDVELTLNEMKQAFMERFGVVPKFRVTGGGL